MDKKYDKRTKRTRSRPKSGNTHQSTQSNSNKIIQLENARSLWNKWFLIQEFHLHSLQTSTRNEQMLTKSICTRMDDRRKDHIDPKGPNQRIHPKQIRTHNLLTDDVGNINSTNKGRYLLIANKPQVDPSGTERMQQRIQRHSRVT